MGNNSSNGKGSPAASGGIGFSGLLTIVFIVLKLCGVIEWSWLWVLSPMWIGFLFSLILIIIYVIISIISDKH